MSTIIATGAGASSGYSAGDWVIQAAPIAISLITMITGIVNYRGVKAAQNDPMKVAMAEKIKAEANSLESIMTRFDSVIELARSSPHLGQRSSGG